MHAQAFFCFFCFFEGKWKKIHFGESLLIFKTRWSFETRENQWCGMFSCNLQNTQLPLQQGQVSSTGKFHPRASFIRTFRMREFHPKARLQQPERDERAISRCRRVGAMADVTTARKPRVRALRRLAGSILRYWQVIRCSLDLFVSLAIFFDRYYVGMELGQFFLMWLTPSIVDPFNRWFRLDGSIICYAAGVITVLLLPVLSKPTYISENALMPGLSPCKQPCRLSCLLFDSLAHLLNVR